MLHRVKHVIMWNIRYSSRIKDGSGISNKQTIVQIISRQSFLFKVRFIENLGHSYLRVLIQTSMHSSRQWLTFRNHQHFGESLFRELNFNSGWTYQKWREKLPKAPWLTWDGVSLNGAIKSKCTHHFTTSCSQYSDTRPRGQSPEGRLKSGLMTKQLWPREWR